MTQRPRVESPDRGRVRIVAVLVLTMTLTSPRGVSADMFAGFAVGRAGRGPFSQPRTQVTVDAGVWAFEWIAVEARTDSVLGAFEVRGQPELVPRSSISTFSVDALVAPLGHRGAARPMASVGVGRGHTIIDTSRGAFRSWNRVVAVGVGVVGGSRTICWRLEIRRTKLAASFVTPFWSASAGVGLVYGDD